MPINFQYQAPTYRPLDFSSMNESLDYLNKRGEKAKTELSNIQDIVNTGDYSDPGTLQIIKDKTNKILKEKGIVDEKGNYKNPSWNYNKYIDAIQTIKSQVAQDINMDKYKASKIKEYQEKSDKYGHNFIADFNPSEISLYDEKGKLKSKKDLDFTGIDLSEQEKMAIMTGQTLSRNQRTGNIVRDNKGFASREIIEGYNPQELESIGWGINGQNTKTKVSELYNDVNTNKVFKSKAINLLQSQNKELTPENIEETSNQLKQEHFYKSTIPFVTQQKTMRDMSDPSYMNEFERLKLKKLQEEKQVPSYQVPTQGYYEVNPQQSVEKVQKETSEIMKNIDSKTKKYRPNTALDEVIRANINDEEPQYGAEEKAWQSGAYSSKSITTSKNLSSFEKIKTDFKKMYEENNKRGGNDETFMKAITPMLIDQEKTKTLKTTYSDSKMQENYDQTINYALLSNLDKEVTVNGKSKPIKKILNGDKLSTTSFKLYDGEIVGTTEKGTTFIMNKNILGEDTEHLLTFGSKVLQNNFKYNDDSFKPVVDNSDAVNIGGKRGYVTYIKSEEYPNTLIRVFSSRPGDKDGNVDKRDLYTQIDPNTKREVYVTSSMYPPLSSEEFSDNLHTRLYGAIDPQLRGITKQNKNLGTN